MPTDTIPSKQLFADYGDLSFGEILCGFRLSDELSQTEFAFKLGLSPANLCDLEKGRKIPSPSRAVQIAKKLRLSPALLIQTALQDTFKRDKLNYRISIAA